MDLVMVEPEPELLGGEDASVGAGGAGGEGVETGMEWQRHGGRVVTPRLVVPQSGMKLADMSDSSEDDGCGDGALVVPVGEGVPTGSSRLRLRPAVSDTRELIPRDGVKKTQARGRERSTTRLPSTVSAPVRSPRRKSSE